MKRMIAVLLTVTIVLGLLSLTACKDGEKIDETGLEFYSVSEIREDWDLRAQPVFFDRYSGDDNALVCCITDEAPGDVTIPATHDGNPVVEVMLDTDAGDSFTSLTLQEGVQYLSHCFNGKQDYRIDPPTEETEFKKLERVSLPSTLTGIDTSFNRCPSLSEINVENVQCIYHSFDKCAVDSLTFGEDELILYEAFKGCESLEKLTIEQSVDIISDSFTECTKLTEATFGGKVNTIEQGSFDWCSALQTVSVAGETGSIDMCFYKCEALTDLSFGGKVSSVTDSFGSASSLKTIGFQDGYGTVSHSFSDCPLLDFNPSKEIAEQEQLQKENDKQSEEYNRITKLYTDALQKLVDDGVIPEPETQESLSRPQFEIGYRDGERFDTLVFLDEEAGQRLYDAPDVSFDKVLLTDPNTYFYKGETLNGLTPYDVDEIKDIKEKLKDPGVIASSLEDSRYVFVVLGIVSNVEKQYYELGYDRKDMTTAVFIIDTEKKEIIHIELIGTDVPPDKTTTLNTGGGIKRADADKYIVSLLQ